MTGKTLLHYEIKDCIGKGGMGEVYRARDTKLGRDVAVKILPAELSGDPEREARFQREARALASLQHPNVASVYGFEEAEGVRFLVMELVPGADLAKRMKDGPLPVEEVLDLARQIAAGLEAAHENGIVHRDLKPGNVMLTDEGEVKILDFGLAQAWFGEAAPEMGSSTMPTITAAMTQAGAILGTAAYMSPEQARGQNVDRRADIWAFGVILFEMLTGKQLFQGETVSDTLAAVLRAEPDWSALPVVEHPTLCRLIERCLERNPRQRLRDIGEARIFLQDGDGSSSSLSFSAIGAAATPDAPTPARLPVAWLVAVAMLGLGIGGTLAWVALGRTEPPPLLHTMIPPPRDTEFDLKGTAPGPAVLSPDGTMLAYAAIDGEARTRLFLRHLDKGEAVALSGTEGGAYPFWSPDSRQLGFFDMPGQKLRKIAVAGGPPVTLCPAANGKGGAWNADGVIIFAPSHNTGIHRVPDTGDDPVAITTVGEGNDSHRHPRFLPGGQEFLYVARATADEALHDIVVASLDTAVAPRVVARSQANAEHADGHLLTVREGVLMATPFAPDAERVTAGGTPLVENILTLQGAAFAVFSPSQTGMIAYQTGAAAADGKMLYLTSVENGTSQGLGDPGQIAHPVVSPDGTRAVIEVGGASDTGIDLWIVDLATGLRTRFTFAPGDETRACWSRDGERVYYQSQNGGSHRIVEQPVEGQGGAAVVLESARPVFPTSVGPDDRDLLINYERESGGFEIRRLSLDAPADTLVTVAARDVGNTGGGQYSPDGRWITFHTESAAGFDVFVMPAAGGVRKWQVTTSGAVYPRWSPDGREIWVSTFSGDLRAYAVDGTSETFQVGAYRTTVTIASPTPLGNHYDLHPDGQHLLEAGNDPDFRAEISLLHLVTDWRRALAQ
jgi:Tol biopolymer transport system component